MVVFEAPQDRNIGVLAPNEQSVLDVKPGMRSGRPRMPEVARDIGRADVFAPLQAGGDGLFKLRSLAAPAPISNCQQSGCARRLTTRRRYGVDGFAAIFAGWSRKPESTTGRLKGPHLSIIRTEEIVLPGGAMVIQRWKAAYHLE